MTRVSGVKFNRVTAPLTGLSVRTAAFRRPLAELPNGLGPNIDGPAGDGMSLSGGKPIVQSDFAPKGLSGQSVELLRILRDRLQSKADLSCKEFLGALSAFYNIARDDLLITTLGGRPGAFEEARKPIRRFALHMVEIALQSRPKPGDIQSESKPILSAQHKQTALEQIEFSFFPEILLKKNITSINSKLPKLRAIIKTPKFLEKLMLEELEIDDLPEDADFEKFDAFIQELRSLSEEIDIEKANISSISEEYDYSFEDLLAELQSRPHRELPPSGSAATPQTGDDDAAKGSDSAQKDPLDSILENLDYTSWSELYTFMEALDKAENAIKELDEEIKAISALISQK